MSSSTPLDIKVIYTASGRRPKKHPVKRRSTRGPGSRGRLHALRWSLLGLMNLAIAGGLYYGTWWPIDRFFYMTAMLHTPLPGVDLTAASAMFGVTENPNTPARQVIEKQAPPPPPRAKFTGPDAIHSIGGTMYGWLALSTISYSLLALAGGVTLGQAGLRHWRRFWWRLSLVWAVGLVVAAGVILARYGTGYAPDHLRFWMGGLTLLPVLLGLALAGGARWINRTAGLAVVAAAIGTVVGWYLLNACDALDPQYTKIPFIAVVFLGHAFYGALLAFPISSRMSR